MKSYSLTRLRPQMVIFALAAVLCAGYVPARCLAQGTALLLQQSPVDGGAVNLSTGVHHFAPDTEVELSATARPGYEFVCWLGDVANPKANTTRVYMLSLIHI